MNKKTTVRFLAGMAAALLTMGLATACGTDPKPDEVTSGNPSYTRQTGESTEAVNPGATDPSATGTGTDTSDTAGTRQPGETTGGKTPSPGNSTPGVSGASTVRTDAPTQPRVTDLNGRTITYLTYWEEPVKGADSKGNAYWEAKKKLEKQLDCTFKFVYGTRDNLATSIMSGKPICDVFSLPANELYNYYKQGLLYAVSDLSAFDFSDTSKWAKPPMEFGKINGKQYGMCASGFEGANFIVYNKEILKKHGQPDLYTLQKQGTLTWEKIFEIARACTDGDTYGLSANMWEQDAMLQIANAYNGVYLKRKGDTLEFTNTMNSSATITAFSDFQKLMVEDRAVRPSNGNWQYLVNEFANGNTAMMFGLPENLMDVSFDAGMCLMPKGRNASEFTPYVQGSVAVLSCIPSTVEKPEEVAAVWNEISSYLGNQDWRVRFQDYLSEDVMECLGLAVEELNKGNYEIDYSSAVLPAYGDTYNTLKAIANGEVTPAAGVQRFNTQINTAVEDMKN